MAVSSTIPGTVRAATNSANNSLPRPPRCQVLNDEFWSSLSPKCYAPAFEWMRDRLSMDGAMATLAVENAAFDDMHSE